MTHTKEPPEFPGRFTFAELAKYTLVTTEPSTKSPISSMRPRNKS